MTEENKDEQGVETTPPADGEALLQKCIDADFKVNLMIIRELLTEAPEKVALPALALRHQARQGKLPEDIIPVLAHLAGGAPNWASFVHFTKALAAFGRQAADAAPHIIFRLQNLYVTDDQMFWVLDSALYALGYLGGEAAEKYLAEISAQKPSLVEKSNSVYEGTITAEQRAKIHELTLNNVTAMIAMEDAGKWDKKMTNLKRKKSDDSKAASKPAGGGLKPWMTR